MGGMGSRGEIAVTLAFKIDGKCMYKPMHTSHLETFTS